MMNSGGSTPGNFREAGEFHCSHVQIDNPMNVNLWKS